MNRRLTDVERAFWLLDRSTSFNGVNTTRLGGAINAEHVRAALAHVQSRHPLLRAVVMQGGDGRERFAPFDGAIPFRVIARDNGDPDRATVDAIEVEEINHRYALGEPLCRVAWIAGDRGGDLVIAHQHVIADAHSAVVMIREIVEALGPIVDGRSPPVVVPLPEPEPLSPSLARAVGLAEKWWAMTAFFFRHVWTLLARRVRKLPLAVVAAPKERRLGIARLALDEGETRALAARCRREGTSMQGILGAALLVAAAEAIGITRAAWLGCFSAVSLRDRIGIHDAMGLYVSQVTTYHRVDLGVGVGARRARADHSHVDHSVDLWSLARELKRDLGRLLGRGEDLVTIPMIGMFLPPQRRESGGAWADPAPRLAARLDLASPATIGVTNIGRVELPRRVGPISLDSFHLAVGPSVVAPLVACAATVHGRLALHFVFAEPLLAAATVHAIADRTGALLRDIEAAPLAAAPTTDLLRSA